MPVLITCKFDKDPIKVDWEKLEKSFFFTAEGQVTPKWLVRYDKNSNPSEILCLCSFPVSLMKSEFIVTEKRWRHHFPPFSQWERSRAYNSVVSGPIWQKFELVWDFMHVLVTCKYRKDRIKTTEKRWRHCFPHYKSMGVSVAMETRVLIQSAPKPYAAFPHPSNATHKIWSRLANWLQRYSRLKVWTATDGRRTIGIL